MTHPGIVQGSGRVEGGRHVVEGLGVSWEPPPQRVPGRDAGPTRIALDQQVAGRDVVVRIVHIPPAGSACGE